MRALATLGALLALAPCSGAEPAEAAPVRAEQIDALLERALDERSIPGLSAVVLRGERIVWSRGYGVADVDDPAPVAATTVFQLGSISKVFLSALVLRLAERELLSLDDALTRHLPEFERLPPQITLRHLLNHTSGIREPFTMAAYQAGIEDLSRPAAELVAMLRQAPVDFPAGARWSYSNANYQLLALVVERITGMPYERALAEQLFQPLGLASLRQCTPLPAAPEEARGHVLRDAAVVPAAPENMSWIRGDGGLCGHAIDVAHWFRLLAAGRAVSPASYRSMSAPTRLEPEGAAEYGLGLSLVAPDGVRKVAHNGAMLGYSASAAHYPDAALTVVVLTNLGGARTEAIERPVARHLLGLPAPERAAQPLSAHARNRYVGAYDIGVFTLRIVARGEGLWLEMPPPGPTTALRYLGDGEFVNAADPDASQLTLRDSGAGAGAGELRLYMGAMRWYGARLR